MSPETPSSSGSDTSSRPPLKGNEERLMVAVRVRPLKNDESHRVLYAADKKVSVVVFLHPIILINNGYYFQVKFELSLQ